MVVSSAKIDDSFSTTEGKSFMNIKNRTGPNTCYSPLGLCHSHFLPRVNAQQWSPRKDQALHSIGSFRPFLLALFFLWQLTIHNRALHCCLCVPSFKLLMKKICLPNCHVFSRSSQHPFGERMFMFEEGKSTNRIVHVGFPLPPP